MIKEEKTTILALRTDNPQAELYLLGKDGKVQAQHVWKADRELANQLLSVMEGFLSKNKTLLEQLTGIVVFKGPGSFTGLRIGVTVANAFAYARNIPVVAASGDDWLQTGVKEFHKAAVGIYAMPEYGAPAHITQPRI